MNADTETTNRKKIEIATKVCENFAYVRQPTLRHDLLNQFEDPNLLAEMESNSLLKAQPSRLNYLPSFGSFALLGDDHELYLRARKGFETAVLVLREFFREDRTLKMYQFNDLLAAATRMGRDVDPDGLNLGLYLAPDFSLIGAQKPSEDGMSFSNVGVSE